jgi:ATP-dependent DNA helicase DinG
MERYFTPEVLETVRREILRSGGNEILFFAWTDDHGRLVRIQTVARGTAECVAVPLEQSFLPDAIVHNHPGGALTPSEQDMRIASVVAAKGVGFLIVDNDLTDVYVVVEPVLKKTVRAIDGTALASLVSAGSRFGELVPGFEVREGQMEMIREVSEAFNGDAVSLIEAGTGIGKSAAYLIPSIEWSRVNRERVVISTNTINLQEQLIHKDIPDVKRALGADFSFVLMKGRSNYLCLNRVGEIRQDLFSFLDDEELDQFNQILQWMEVTEDGSLSDLSFVPKPAFWEKINSGSEMCLGGSCGYFGRCFVNRVKRKAITARLVVTNHHYLLADASLLETGASILPSYDRVVFDEAHNIEDSATSFFTKTVTLSGTLRLLNRLYSEGKRKKGYLLFLQKQGLVGHDVLFNKLADLVKKAKASAFDLFTGIDGLFTASGSNLDTAPSQAGSSAELAPSRGEGFPVIEMGEELREHPLWRETLAPSFGFFRTSLGEVAENLGELVGSLEKKGEEKAVRQLGGFCVRIGDILKTVDLFLSEEDRDYARWIEKRREAAVSVALVEIGPTLKHILFSRVKTAVFTSATLTVAGSFDFLESRLSLERSSDRETREAVIPSPFDYDSQMAVLLPTDIVDPDHPGFGEALSRGTAKILKKTRGKAFVLFTSYKTMNEVFDRVKPELDAAGFVAFRQGSESRRSLLDRFKSDVHSILFGTESFWEGVDVPGEALECVIITKLPFKVPTEPIVKARLERVRVSGGDPFLDYSLPSAVMKLKQGAGRLIRNRSDRGIVVIMDRRVQTRRYGRVFLASMQGGTRLTGTLDEILLRCGGFLTDVSSPITP